MHIPPPPPVSIQYANWAGYEWQSSTAAAQFTVPSFPYSRMSAAERNNRTVLAIWAGLGTGPSIEQIGIYDYVQNGHVGWAGFCAFWPSTDASCGGGISTGDVLQVSVHRSGFKYTMSMRDVGKWTVSISRTLPNKDNTAEVIAEDTQYAGDPFTNLTYFSPFKATVSGNPATEIYSRWGRGIRLNSRTIEIEHT